MQMTRRRRQGDLVQQCLLGRLSLGIVVFSNRKAHCVDRISAVKKYLVKCLLLQAWVVLPINRLAC